MVDIDTIVADVADQISRALSLPDPSVVGSPGAERSSAEVCLGQHQPVAPRQVPLQVAGDLSEEDRLLAKGRESASAAFPSTTIRGRDSGPRPSSC